MDKVIVDYLDNSLCTKTNASGLKECVYKPRDIEKEPVLGIMLHYTACQSIESTKHAYYSGGVSSHYTIDHDEKSYCHVDPSNIAFHAGLSQFRSITPLNKYFIGIEHVNPGFIEIGKTYDESVWGKPVQLLGDSRFWFNFSEAQFVTSASLTTDLQKAYRIRSSLVITHADAAIGRKSDIGPMYNYKRAFFEFGAGYFPEKREIDLSKFSKLTSNHYMNLLHLYGYQSLDHSDINEVRAFQMHFSPADISGELSDITKTSIINLCIDYSEYNDIYHGVDSVFSEGLSKFIMENSEVTTGFKEFIGD